MVNAPCKNCKDRTIEPNCHMSCVKYIEFTEENKRAREVREMAMQKELPLPRCNLKSHKMSTTFSRIIHSRGRGSRI